MKTRASTLAPVLTITTKRLPQRFGAKGLCQWLLLTGGFLLSACLRADISLRESIECLVDRSDVIAVYEVSSITGPSHGEWSDRYQATLKLAYNLRGSGTRQITKTLYIDTTPYASEPRPCAVKSGHQFVKFFVSGDPEDRDAQKYFMGENSVYLNNETRDANFGLAVTADFRILHSREAILAAIKNRMEKGRQITGTDRWDLLNCLWPDKAPRQLRRPVAKEFMGIQIPFSAQDWRYLTPSGIEFRFNMKGPDVLMIPIDLYYPYLREIDRLHLRSFY